jgi:hypothetical protein
MTQSSRILCLAAVDPPLAKLRPNVSQFAWIFRLIRGIRVFTPSCVVEVLAWEHL